MEYCIIKNRHPDWKTHWLHQMCEEAFDKHDKKFYGVDGGRQGSAI
jgi:hypothetical protein